MGCGASSEAAGAAGPTPDDAPLKPVLSVAPSAPSAVPAGDEAASPKFSPSQQPRDTLDTQAVPCSATHVPSKVRRPSLDERFSAAVEGASASFVPSGALSLDDKFKAGQAADAPSTSHVPAGALSLDDKFKAAEAEQAAEAAVEAVVEEAAGAPSAQDPLSEFRAASIDPENVGSASIDPENMEAAVA